MQIHEINREVYTQALLDSVWNAFGNVTMTCLDHI